MAVVHRHGDGEGGVLGAVWAERPAEAAGGAGKALVVTGASYVAVYAAGADEERVCLKMWTMSSGAKSASKGKKGKKKQATQATELRGPAVIVPGSSTLVALCDSGLLMWDFFQESLQLPMDAVKPLSAEVHGIFTDARLGGRFLVVFKDGTVSLRKADNSQVAKETGGEDGARVATARLARTTKKRRWCLTITETLKSGPRLRLLHVAEDALAPGSTFVPTAPAGSAGEAPGTLCATAVHSNALVTLLWSNGRAQVVSLPRTAAARVQTTMPLPVLRHAAAASGRSSAGRKRSRTASVEAVSVEPEVVDAAQRDAAVVFMAHGATVLAVDATLGARVASMETAGAVIGLVADPERKQLAFTLENGDVCVEVCAGGALAAAGESSTLAKIMLRGAKSAESEESTEGEAVQAGCPDMKRFVAASGRFDADAWREALEKSEQDVADGVKTLTSKRLKKDERLQALDGNQESFHLVKRSVDALVDAKDWEGLEALMYRQPLSAVTNPGLLGALMAANQVWLLYLALKHVDHVEEAAAMNVLRYVLQKAPKAALTRFAGKCTKLTGEAQPEGGRKLKGKRVCKTEVLLAEQLSALAPHERAIQYFVLAALSLPKNEVFFVQAVKRLPGEIIKVLLHSVAVVIALFDALPVRENIFTPGTRELRGAIVIPDMGMCIRLLSALLDASLDFVSEERDEQVLALMKKMLVTCGNQVNVVDQLRRLECPIRFCVEDRSLLPAKTVSDYTLEHVSF